MQVEDANKLWMTCVGPLRAQISEATWRTWFEGVQPSGIQDNTLTLSVPSMLAKERIQGRYLGLLEDTFAENAGRQIRIELSVVASSSSLQEPVRQELTTSESVMALSQPASAPNNANGSLDRTLSSSSSRRGRGSQDDIPLNSRYTFEAFVIGSSNRFAHAAALSVAEAPARSYNPLFIHGAAGLGKTHLLHAIGNYVKQNFPLQHVRYVSTETFMNDFVEAIRSNATSAFKRRYRECDVLLVDDIQFMEKKESLQEEFFHTFNSLYGASSQIVITSDRPPKSIATLEDRLRSRFLSGLITDVQPPELETRLAILRSKAELEQVAIPANVLEFIATHVKDNIRELEGALIRVCAFASLNDAPLSLDLAEMVLSDIVSSHPRRITPASILDTTADAFGFTVEELKGTSRRRPLVTARQVGMYVFRELTDFSYPAIAREFGGRDHTTVIHAVEKISSLMKERRQIYDQVTDLLLRIRGGG